MQVDDGHDIDVVMPMYNLTEYSDSHGVLTLLNPPTHPHLWALSPTWGDLLIQLQNSNWFTKNIILLVHKLQSIHPKQYQKQIIHENNKLCILQTIRKITRSIKKNKSNFINITGHKFTMNIR